MSDLLHKYQKQFKEITQLYDFQTEVFKKLKDKKNTLAIIPTGGGKSLLYQLMSLDLEGVTLVISPLLALMEEQVNELNNKRGIKALALNSTLSFKEQRNILRELKEDSYKLIYVSPERLQNAFFRAFIVASGVKISMIVVDEAHCISQWGSNFRPEYAQINGFVDFLGQNNHSPFLLCLTATLSKLARKDILTEFQIHEDYVYISKSVIRTNLKHQFKKVEREENKIECLKEFLLEHKPKKTIAYLYSKRECENYAQHFSEDYKTNYYHAAIDSEEKHEVYNCFVNNEIQILFATTAFGMGINIPDIDCVIHVHIPNSVEEYYQQVGRGWRIKSIEKNCECFALWSDVNFERRKSDLERSKYNAEYLEEAYKALIGGAKIRKPGQIVNKDKNALINSEYNLQRLRYKLEKRKIIRTVGEINGSPLTIKFVTNTELWNKIVDSAKGGMDSFGYVSKDIGIPVADIISHLYEEDIKSNIKDLPAMQKEIYFEILEPELKEDVVQELVNEINAEIDYKINQLDELKELYTSENINERLEYILN